VRAPAHLPASEEISPLFRARRAIFVHTTTATTTTANSYADDNRPGSNAHLLAELQFIRDFPAGSGKLRSGWDTRRGSALLTLAGEKLAGTARAQGMEAIDAVAAAWQVWKGSHEVLGAENPWGWTRKAVERELAREHRAQRLLTSTAAMRRVDFEEPEQDHFADLDEVADFAAPTAEERNGFKTLALQAAVILLTKYGYTPVVAESIIEAILDGAAVGATMPRMATDVLTRRADLRTELGMAAPEWAAFIALLFGSRRGEIGTIEAELRGIDPASVKQIRMATRRFEAAIRFVG
jgi:hypothetical protein